METVGMSSEFDSTYADRRVLVTGHTGFKGSWLCRWLERLGATVAGYSLAPPSSPSHHDLLAPAFRQWTADVRDSQTLTAACAEFQPEIVFHLAAQALVRQSYREPLATFETNVAGTANLLEACRRTDSVKAVVVVTTDKCYRNREWLWAYRENDELGGHDPYSASKACAELVVASYRDAFLRERGVLVASARAGNVIGGGDWADDRLIPDLVRAAVADEPLTVRNPQATRPWQHVLEPLAGYLLLGRQLLAGRAECAEAWNFGPDASANLTVGEMVTRMGTHWPALRCQSPALAAQPHEANLLMLDSTKARRLLGWQPVWDVGETLARSAQWYRAFHEQGHVLTDEQIGTYAATLAQGKGT
ncbi:MAG: CDP-glucose 4,6-dehydratase [Victivallales bacterium]|nr:CDP-glucose 4,6-dehydratase [Victivallales bacterium]